MSATTALKLNPKTYKQLKEVMIMERKSVISDKEIERSLLKWGWDGYLITEGRLMLLELLVKVNAGWYVSSTESGFLFSFGLLKKDRTANKKGRLFICEMIYKHSNLKPDCYEAMKLHRADILTNN